MTILTAPCPACCAPTITARSAFYRESALVRCPSCGTEALQPQPSDDRLRDIYGHDYYAVWGLDDDHSVELMKQATFEWILGRWRLAPGSRILDLGCATGFLLALAAKKGFVPYGVDLNPVAVEQGRLNLPQASWHCGTLADDPFPGVSFDAVYMVDLLEHVRAPRAELSLVHDRLTPGGVAIISLPSLDSWSRKAMGLRWMQYREEHLTYFTRAGLGRLLQDTGFEIVETRPTRKTVTLAYVHRHLQKYRHPVLTPLSKALWHGLPVFRSTRIPMKLGEITVVAQAV